MLPNRQYSPNDSDVIYHYCSAESFLAICNSKCIRLTDVFSMNDFMEMRWGYHVWEMAATKVADETGIEFLNDIDLVIHESGGKALPLAACLSRDGDLLSQWRA